MYEERENQSFFFFFGRFGDNSSEKKEKIAPKNAQGDQNLFLLKSGSKEIIYLFFLGRGGGWGGEVHVGHTLRVNQFRIRWSQVGWFHQVQGWFRQP